MPNFACLIGLWNNELITCLYFLFVFLQDIGQSEACLLGQGARRSD